MSVKADREKIALPLPFLDWGAVLRAFDPLRSPTRSWARSLRKRGRLSPGVTVPRYGEHGVHGSGTYHSSLWTWAERCSWAGFTVDARMLRTAAQTLEEAYSGPLASFLSQHELAELPRASFFEDVMKATAEAMASVSCLEEVVVAAGKVSAVLGGFGHVVGMTPAGSPTMVDLPAKLLTKRGIEPGEVVWVVERLVEAAALLEVDDTVLVDLPKELTQRLRWAAAVQNIAVADSLEVEEAVDALRYARTSAYMPPEGHWADLLAEVEEGKYPVTRLRLAG